VTARVLLLTEDSGFQAQPTVRALVAAAAKLVNPALDTRRLDLRPLAEGDLAARAIRANAWKQKKPTPERTLLVRTIANELVQDHFVVLHFDSDTSWSKRKSSENRLKFETHLRAQVQLTLTTPRPKLPWVPLSASEASERVGRLFEMAPCYSIESWLYQATAALKRTCDLHHQKAAHVALIERWRADRTLLDEVERPKDGDLTDCVSDRYNEVLVKEFPADDVFRAERSWREFVDRLAASPPLRRALGLEQ
jgi:hypothetical protein